MRILNSSFPKCRTPNARFGATAAGRAELKCVANYRHCRQAAISLGASGRECRRENMSSRKKSTNPTVQQESSRHEQTVLPINSI